MERSTLLVVGERARAMDHPDMPLRIDGDAADLAEQPVVRQRLWPRRVAVEGRDVTGMRGRRRRGKHDSGEAGSNGSGESQASARALRRHECLPMIFLGGCPAWKAVK